MGSCGALEIEVKFHLEDVEQMRHRVLEMGARHRGTCFESNTLHDDAVQSLSKGGRLLRLRQDDACRLTYKAPRQGQCPQFKVHRETEVVVSDAAAMQRILEALGFPATRRYEKYRETYSYAATSILIDTLPYGSFVELEGEPADLRAVSHRLGLIWHRRILATYIEMFEIIKADKALDFVDVTFSNFQDLRLVLDDYLLRFEAGWE